MDWKHGYFADTGYTYGIYAETLPTRLRWASLMQGHVSAATGFRYLDAGCGQGLGLIAAAAAHPDSEFVGIDFMPEHVAHGKRLAHEAGLKNVTFIEADFHSLAADWLQQPALQPGFDYAVCHGINTWIAPDVRESLFRLVGEKLRPGGVFYNSYNTYPGWLAMVPFQHMVLMESRRRPGKPALAAAQAHIEELGKLTQTLLQNLPGMNRRLEQMKAQDAAYLVQEYNNQHWAPVFVTQMMDMLRPHKLNYLGTATLPDLFDGTISKGVREWLATFDDPAMKEQMRDLALNQSFRRDLYVKGQIKPWAGQPWHLHDPSWVVSRNEMVARPADGQPFTVKGGSTEIKAAHALYSSVLDTVEKGGPQGIHVREIESALDTRQRQLARQATSLLIQGGWIHLRTPSGTNGHMTNKALSHHASLGAPYRNLLLTGVDAVLPVGDTEWLLVQALTHEVPQEKWPQHVLNGLKGLNKQLAQDGKPITDHQQAMSNVTALVREFQEKRLPVYRAAGAL